MVEQKNAGVQEMAYKYPAFRNAFHNDVFEETDAPKEGNEIGETSKIQR
jgi:hypothetical protein